MTTVTFPILPTRAHQPLFEFGAFRPLIIREESIPTLQLPGPVRLLYISDLHLGLPWTSRVAHHVISLAHHHRPDLTFLGGDLIDRVKGLPLLAHLVEQITRVCPLHAIPGNHDRPHRINTVRATIESSGGQWLPATPLQSHNLTFHAHLATRPVPPNTILIAHNPNIFKRAAQLGYHLVLAGHLHGGQCVLAIRNNRLYPGAFFSKYTGLRFHQRSTTMLVSRGAADTLPFRFNCPREAILAHLH